jgi:osmotically-inducible protein OsmY
MGMNSAPVEPAKVGSPANDALLAQLVRGALGRSGRGTSGINVSSCSFVVMLHGSVGSVEEREEVGRVASTVPGVESVTNKLRVR